MWTSWKYKNFNSRPHGGRPVFPALFPFQVYFNSRPHGGRLGSWLRIVVGKSYFNSRPHGGRLRFGKNLLDYSDFNSRPHGGRLHPLPVPPPYSYFNSRPHGGRLISLYSLMIELYFNSRPHGGRRCFPYWVFPRGIISTHALTEGDRNASQGKHNRDISTHALTEGDFICKWNNRVVFHFNSRPHGGRLPGQFLSTALKNFNSRPHGGRLYAVPSFIHHPDISTHALTEGDGKFRQIFLLNRGYAYSISLYFLPHFISLLPQILSFQQKSFKFQVRIFLLFSVHLAFALQNQCVHHVKYRFCTNMFYFVFVLFTQIVKPQTIGLFIYDFF